MTIKNDAKFEGGQTCHSKINMSDLTNFDPSTRKYKKFVSKWAAFDQSICFS